MNNTNKIKLKDPLKKEKTSILTKLSEFILYVGTSSLIIFYIFKNVFGTPLQHKINHENIKQMTSQIDTIKAMEQFNMDGIYSIKDSVGYIITSIDNLSIAIDNNTKEINNMKKVVNQKIVTANRITSTNNIKSTQQNKPIDNTNKIQVLDSFFRAKYNNHNKE
jgi:hypothetical protein